MNFLVLVANYPDLNGNFSLAYVRTRCVYYKSQGVDIDVLNFACKEDYEIDGIKVYSLSSYKKLAQKKHYDLVLSHASNIRNHYIFLMKYGKYFSKIVFFYHGHEVLKINKVYSKPYPFMTQNKVRIIARNTYDEFKFWIWRNYIRKNYKKLYHIFVSHWMKDNFMQWVSPRPQDIEGRCFITYNSVGKIFEEETYNDSKEKDFDFITIRSYLDNSKYAIDIVNNLARQNPQKKFIIIGKGNFFNHYARASNVTWINQVISHSQMVDYINSAKCALMPTRTDAQGVMMCEMATFGIPLITSDIPVCHEVFKEWEGIGFISNEHYTEDDITLIYQNIKNLAHKDKRYFYSVAMGKELGILKNIVNRPIGK